MMSLYWVFRAKVRKGCEPDDTREELIMGNLNYAYKPSLECSRICWWRLPFSI